MKIIRQLARGAMVNAMTALRRDAVARRRQQQRIEVVKTALIRITITHASAAADAGAFREQLTWVRQHFNLIDFATLKRLWSDKIALADQNGRPCALISFDDGLLSNYEVAAPLLEEFGARGVFFVAPTF